MLQVLFGNQVSVAVQDPSYPVYVDSSVIMGMTGGYNGSGYDNIQYMVCRPDTDFFPDLSQVGCQSLHGVVGSCWHQLHIWHLVCFNLRCTCILKADLVGSTPKC